MDKEEFTHQIPVHTYDTTMCIHILISHKVSINDLDDGFSFADIITKFIHEHAYPLSAAAVPCG